MDLFEPHIWIANRSDFNQRVGYFYDQFETRSMENLVKNGERVYRENEAHWLAVLDEGIDACAAWSAASGKRLVTTEAWGVVDYKDWPLLSWDWVKEPCAHGARRAVATGRWAAICTSNFCGPQFLGMWRDLEWHRTLTKVIRASRIV